MVTSENRLILQGFEWHTESSPPAPNETHSASSQYTRLTRLLPSFADLGITSLWLPPGCKGNSPQGNGYDVYDLWDLGEFEQKGARSTKWGSREELEDLLAKGRDCGVEMIWDAVLNHKAGGDSTEECWAVEVDREDRRYEICEPKKIEAWLRFDFHGREKDGTLRYSDFRWRPEHFNGTDWDQRAQKNAICKLIDDPTTASKKFQQPKRPVMGRNRPSGRYFRSFFRGSGSSVSIADKPPAQRPGKSWAEDVDKEHGNYDYLMFSNIDYTHPDARRDVINWGQWMINETGVDGFRLDAVKHFSFSFARDWILNVQQTSMQKRNKDVFVVGEIWSGELPPIIKWLDAVQTPSAPQVYAYDSPLLYNFCRISEAIRRRNVDLRTILRGSLLESRPQAAVTLVTNHDTQPGQVSYAPMASDLKSIFYAIILLRQEGLPCVFWGDLFGTRGPYAEEPITPFAPRLGGDLGTLMLCRRLFAYGKQTDYWQSKDCIGWTRAGTEDKPGCAVLFCVGSPKRIRSIEMSVGVPGEVWVELSDNHPWEVTIDGAGIGRFRCFACDVSIWVRKDAPEVQRFPVQFDIGLAR